MPRSGGQREDRRRVTGWPAHRADPVLAPTGRRAGAVRRLPAGVPAARGAARPVLHPGPGRRPGGVHLVRSVQRVLPRPGGEEAAEPLPAGVLGALLRHRRLQPGLQLLPELGPRETDTLADAAAPEVLAAAAEALGARSVAFTYNDPTIFLEYAADVADACHRRGVKAIAVSAGYIEPAARRELYAHMDAANIDLKAFTEDFYHRVCAGHLGPVLD